MESIASTPQRRSLRLAPLSSSASDSPFPADATATKATVPCVTPEPNKPGTSTLDSREALLELPGDCVVGDFRCRPSKRNRSPYVADVYLPDEDRTVICHVPSMDVGGRCVAGAKLLMRPARDSKGRRVPADAVSAKYGTPKCEYIAQLLLVDEEGYDPVWTGAHPTLGEMVAEQLIRRNLLGSDFPPVETLEREKTAVGGSDMRTDFLVTHTDSTRRVLEVKTVCDTDYSSENVPEGGKLTYSTGASPYTRAAIFPWGKAKQKTPDGTKAVSARAIKHVNELAKLASKGDDFDATVLFIVMRKDVKVFRPNHESCPSLCRALLAARGSGVQVLAKQVYFENRSCFEGVLLPIVWPNEAQLTAVEDELPKRKKTAATKSGKASLKRARSNG